MLAAMTRHADSHLLALLATVGFALVAVDPLVAAERLGGGGLRQQPHQSPPGAAERNRGPGPMGQPPGPAGTTGPAGARIPARERQPSSSASITHRGTRYLVRGGQWYERRGGDLVAAVPPEGVLVKNLPDGHSMRWIGGVPYFYADGLYYVWRERPRRYEILTTPPVEATAPQSEGRPDGGPDTATTP